MLFVASALKKGNPEQASTGFVFVIKVTYYRLLSPPSLEIDDLHLDALVV